MSDPPRRCQDPKVTLPRGSLYVTHRMCLVVNECSPWLPYCLPMDFLCNSLWIANGLPMDCPLDVHWNFHGLPMKCQWLSPNIAHGFVQWNFTWISMDPPMDAHPNETHMDCPKDVPWLPFWIPNGFTMDAHGIPHG